MVKKTNLSANLVLLLLIAIVLISGTVSQTTKIREWPTKPAEPKSWQNYIIYLAAVLLTPILIGFLLWFISWILCCVSCVNSANNKKDERMVFTLGRIRMYSCVPYCFLWALATSATISAVVFFIVFLITFATNRASAFTFVRDVIQKPRETKQTISSFSGIIPEIVTDIKNIIKGVDQFQVPLKKVEGILNDTKAAVYEMPVYLDNIAGNYSEIIRITNGMESLGFPSINVGSYNFPDSSALTGGAITSLDSFSSKINGASAQINTVVTSVGGRIDDMEILITGKINDLTAPSIDLINKAQAYIDQYLGDIDKYEQYTKIGEAVLGAVVGTVICLMAVVLTCGIAAVVQPKPIPLGCLACDAAGSIPIYFIIGAIHLLLWFLSQDVCDQGEGYFAVLEKTASEKSGIKQLEGVEIPQSNITLKISEAVLGVLHCKEGESFLDAVGLGLDQLNLTQRMDTYKNKFGDSLNKFNVKDYIGGSTSALTSFIGNNTIPTTFVGKASLLDKEIQTNFDTMKTKINSNLNTPEETTAYKTLNDLTFRLPSQYHYWVRENVSACNAGDYLTPTDRVSAVSAALTVVLAFKNVYDTAQQQLVDAQNNLTQLTTALYNMERSINDSVVFVESIKEIPNRALPLIDEVDTIVKSLVSNITALVDQSVVKVTKNITGSPILQCRFIGRFYGGVKESVCGRIRLCLGGTTISSLSMGNILFLIFCVVLICWYMSRNVDDTVRV